MTDCPDSLCFATKVGKWETMALPAQKMAAYCAINAYIEYDVKGRPDDPNIITERQIAAMNRAMMTRSPLKAWREANLLNISLPELAVVPNDWDLIEMSDDEWESTLPILKALYKRVLPRVGINTVPGTKVLHLMRPRLVAICDNLVMNYLGITDADPVKKALAVADAIRMIGRAGENQQTLTDIQEYLRLLSFIQSDSVPSKCRIVDALLWMNADVNGKRYERLWEVMGI
jgi:hypothetical protein